MYSDHHKRSGFSLIEVMVALAIIGMLAGLLTVNVRKRMAMAKRNMARSEIGALVDEVETYRIEHGRYPTTAEGLGAVTDAEEPLDPWGNPYAYNCPGLNHEFEIISYGADGVEGGDGPNADVTSWQLRERRRAE